MSKFFFLLAFLLAATARADDDRDILYQISTIDALLSGVYDPLATLGDVLPHGNFGLGTFAALDGELILLDGQVYQAAADGKVSAMPPATATPFIVLTHFDADQSFDLPATQRYAEFKTWLESRLPSRNLAYAVRVDGHFDQLTFRSVPSQSKPYPPLAQIANQQTVFERQGIDGTLIGFWCPDFMQGINVPGFHLHFLSADRQQAGHVLDFRLATGRVQLDATDGWKVQLPLAPAFLDAKLGEDRSAALHAIEQGQSAKSP